MAAEAAGLGLLEEDLPAILGVASEEGFLELRDRTVALARLVGGQGGLHVVGFAAGGGLEDFQAQLLGRFAGGQFAKPLGDESVRTRVLDGSEVDEGRLLFSDGSGLDRLLERGHRAALVDGSEPAPGFLPHLRRLVLLHFEDGLGEQGGAEFAEGAEHGGAGLGRVGQVDQGILQLRSGFNDLETGNGGGGGDLDRFVFLFQQGRNVRRQRLLRGELAAPCDGPVGADDAVALRRRGPARQRGQGFGPDQVRHVAAERDHGKARRVVSRARAEVGVHDAEQHRRELVDRCIAPGHRLAFTDVADRVFGARGHVGPGKRGERLEDAGQRGRIAERGQRRLRCKDRKVVHGPGGFEGDERIGILQHRSNLGFAAQAEGDRCGLANSG